MTDTIESFSPSLSQNSTGSWTASIRLPVIGECAVTGSTWGEAKMKLWLVSEAVEMLSRQSDQATKPPSKWNEAEWRQTLETMKKIMQKPKSMSHRIHPQEAAEALFKEIQNKHQKP